MFSMNRAPQNHDTHVFSTILQSNFSCIAMHNAIIWIMIYITFLNQISYYPLCTTRERKASYIYKHACSVAKFALSIYNQLVKLN